MLRLLTFGGAAVVNESGDDVSSAATQRRTLALLSILAVAGPAGVSRERLVALLWPDAEPERGRHALAQALYASRRSLACDDLFDAGVDVKIRPDRMTSDVADFERLRSHDAEAAVTLFKGPFLDGFFLPGSTEFEHWSTAQRTRIENQVIEALERLATRANDPRHALRSWKRAAALRPLDGQVAVRLMNALVESGDRAGALRHAAIHSALLRDELAVEPDRSVTDLVRSLREPTRDDSRVHVAAPAATVVTPTSLPAPSRPNDPLSAARSSWRRVIRSPVWFVAIAAVTVAFAAIAATLPFFRSTDTPKLPFAHRVIVAPFRVAGADPSLSYLRDGIVELLTARLSGGVRSTDAGAVLGAWRAAGISPAMDVPRDTVVQVASRLEAERVVVGGVVGAPRHIVIRATMLRVPTAAVISQAIVEGPADSVASLAGQLAAELLGAPTAAAGERRIGSGGRIIATAPRH